VAKILGIIGSPNKQGNTALLVREVLKTAEAQGSETKILCLADFQLSPCNGCRSCLETGKCMIKDDIEELFTEMLQADGIVIGSPVYFGGVTAQVKTFIDRVGYLNKARGREAFRRKIGGCVVVGRHSGLLNTYIQILLFLLDARMIIPGTRWVLGRGFKNGDVEKDSEGISLARELGYEINNLANLTKPLRT